MGVVRRVRVTSKMGRDWGIFDYCDVARKKDEDSHLIVTEVKEVGDADTE
jgi:hypothetical protein